MSDSVICVIAIEIAASHTPTWVSWADGLGSLTTVLVAVAAGSFGYFKFLRGRVFRPRCDLIIDAEFVTVGEAKTALVRATIKNSGQALWSIDASRRNLIYVYTLDQLMLDDARSNLDDVVWQGGDYREARIVTEKTTPLESGESLNTSVLLPLSDEARGFRAFVWVWGTGGRWSPRDWSADTVVVEGVG